MNNDQQYQQLIIELLPYLIGSILTILALRLILGKKVKFDRRPLSTPSLYFSYAPDPVIVAELQVMFPNIPKAYIVRELDRAEGVQSAAIDALLLINPDFSGSNGENEEFATPSLISHNKNYRNLFNEIVQTEDTSNNGQYVETPEVRTAKITRKDWNTTTPQERMCELTERKRLMLLKAREQFRKSQERHQ